ncbi:hypothetical protein GQ602_002440 [Ophiocordyceps camponoti-floridani]|uniref:Uncharacterized protein n=1 Tax=Ophiocordyceps camponoti-floridani TaxID=2030778 RepID=A0A8H4QAH2_9HYPO|nr:hypothetical protein GQ602_002440 [Ophiocordyceps camponoti-floridani]
MSASEATPERTSSFRRMLEMERAYMIERLQAKKSPEGSIPNDLQPCSPLSQAENIIRRASTVDGDLKPPKSSLSVNTRLPIPRLPGESLGFDEATTAVGTPAAETTPIDKAASPQGAVTRQPSIKEAADDRSICVSPSWESHGRRRKEKKMMEKKEKEEAAVRAAAAAAAKSARKGRLSKQPPPASSAEALRKAEGVPDPNLARGRDKDRSKSAAAGSTGSQRKPRSRSSSFASLIRSPLNFRRTSVDKAPVEPEFVGGIKLELERHIASDKQLEQHQLRDESVVHPALRQSRASGDRWLAPLHSHPTSTAGSPRETSRAYPPITRQERTYRGRSLAVPPTPITAPATPDTGKLDQWRARVGLDSSPQPPTPPSEEHEFQLREPEDDSDIVAIRHSRKSRDEDVFDDDDDFDDALGLDDFDDDDISPGRSRHRAASTSMSRKKPAGLSIFPPPVRRSRDMEVEGADRLRRKSSDAQGGYRTAPSTPPEPPRRSPKRASKASLDHGLPPLPNSSVTVDDATAARIMTPSEVSPATVTPRTAKRMVVKPATQINQVVSRRKSSKSKDQHHSEESAGSDEFHSPSSPSTPATSRSESDKALPERPLEKVPRAGAKHLSTDSSLTDGSAAPPDRGIHEIQAAADKVLASYREATSGSRQVRHRRDTEPAVRGIVPQPMVPARDRPLRSSVATGAPASHGRRDNSPGTYLEEARRVPLSGVPARVAKPRLGPPTSFALPEEEMLMTRPSLSQREREPVAKVFVECCFCHFYHDMPSNLYEAMANPEAALSGRDTMEYGSSISMTVRCPWCRHEMSTRCCAGLAAMVYVTERLH